MQFKKRLFSILILALVLTISCKDDALVTSINPNDQKKIDLGVIQDYITEQGYTATDTTASGVWYTVLDSGSGEEIDYNDIVDMHFTGRLIDGTVFDTSLESVARANDVYDTLKSYVPIQFSLVKGGWTLTSYIPGFKDGITAVMDDLRVGGHAQIILPSALGYGRQPPFGSPIPPNTVITFDLYPVKVRK